MRSGNLPKLYFGPMSPEAVLAVVKYSHDFVVPLGLIASLNQVNYLGGYTGWTTRELVNSVHSLCSFFPRADVLICRDHFGPDFAHDRLNPSICISDDIASGLDLIHVDFSKFECKEEIVGLTIDMVCSAKAVNPGLLFEVGTDENVGEAEQDIGRIEKTLKEFLKYFTPTYYVVNTGSLVEGLSQTGNFSEERVKPIRKMLNSYGVKLKEHNADYLQSEEINQHAHFVDALNVAPELGTTQSRMALPYMGETKNVVLNRGSWKKWCGAKCGDHYKLECAAHYHFSETWEQILYNAGSEAAQLQNDVYTELYFLIHRYVSNF